MQIIIYMKEILIYYYGHVLNAYYGLTLINIIICVLFRLSESISDHKLLIRFNVI